MSRMIGIGDSAKKWVLTCLERPRMLSDIFFLRDVALGEVADPQVFMCLHGMAGSGVPKVKAQVLLGGFTMKITSTTSVPVAGDMSVALDITFQT